MFSYKVTKHYPRDTERDCAQFKELKDAQFFIEKRLQEDANLKTQVTYRIYDGMDLLEEFDVSKQSSSTSASAASTQTAGGKGSGASFRPTPFNTSPTPSGLPRKWVIDEEEDKDKE